MEGNLTNVTEHHAFFLMFVIRCGLHITMINNTCSLYWIFKGECWKLSNAYFFIQKVRKMLLCAVLTSGAFDCVHVIYPHSGEFDQVKKKSNARGYTPLPPPTLKHLPVQGDNCSWIWHLFGHGATSCGPTELARRMGLGKWVPHSPCQLHDRSAAKDTCMKSQRSKDKTHRYTG